MAEKKDVWSKLWTRKVTPEGREDWLYEVKAEGDRLNEKAGYWDGHLSTLTQLGAMMTDSAVYDMGKLADILKTLPELIEKAEKLDELMKEPERCGYFKPGYGCDSPTGIGNSVMCRKLPDCEVLAEEGFWKQVKAARDKLYEDLPTGDVDAFALIKVVQTHIAKLDEILGDP